MQSQYLESSQRISQVDNMAGILSNEYNDPKLLEKIAEANLTKHAL
jgi:hypothetical protein